MPALRKTRPLRLDDQLALAHWVAVEFGYDSLKDLWRSMRDVGEGFDASGSSRIVLRMRSRSMASRVPPDRLHAYDSNVRHHLEAMNRSRRPPITLRYFQHLAALATEHYLRLRAESRPTLLASLNRTVETQRQGVHDLQRRFPSFHDADLDRLAFWMATGSGKTLLLHLHYRQFLHYTKKPLDNILLVTPNAGLSVQHIRDAHDSGIPAGRFGEQEDLYSVKNTVNVIEITKLVEEKTGGGASVPIEAFEGRNLIFVDEGHKGSGGDAWRKVRDALGATGFTFEYSATFGQALARAKDDTLTRRYGRSILFDYSYKWFYKDGYGKDFRIVNVEAPSTASGPAQVRREARDALLLGGLLVFHEQCCVFRRGGVNLRRYRIAPPLWVFVGGTVNAMYTRARKERSDVLDVCLFFDRFLRDRAWAEKTARRILDGNIGTLLGTAHDPFKRHLRMLRRERQDIGILHNEIRHRIFGTARGGGLCIQGIRRGDSEIGLRAIGADAYFGVVYVGDGLKFLKLAEREEPGLVGPEDVVSDALFPTINNHGSSISVLVGAKRFIEGWNSWRVSAMGLLNLGRTEGSQIIQLFGRGVRLRGLNFGMRRSGALPHERHPENLPLLETLNIFGVRAAYMRTFQKYLRQEGVSERIPLALPVRIRTSHLRAGLVVPRIEEETSFCERGEAFTVEADASDAQVSLNLAPRVQTLSSQDGSVFARGQEESPLGEAQPVPQESLVLLDWERARLDLIEYAQWKGYRAAIIREEALCGIVGKHCTLSAEGSVLNPGSYEDLERLQDAVSLLLRKYLDRVWRKRRESWEAQRMTYCELTRNDGNLAFGRGAGSGTRPEFTVRVPDAAHKKDIEREIQILLNQQQDLAATEQQGLRRLRTVEFGRQLYEPLLAQRESERWTASPPALNKSERRFVTDLREYWRAAQQDYPGTRIFLLRNLTRGAGIGFFRERGFYPDFILWLMTGRKQHVVFVEPHGMMRAPAYGNDEKARLHERLPGIARQAARRAGRSDVTLDSYIVSATSFATPRKRYDSGDWTEEKFAQKHFLFFPGHQTAAELAYIERIFRDQLGRAQKASAVP